MLDGQERLDLIEAGRRAISYSLCCGRICESRARASDAEDLGDLGKKLEFDSDSFDSGIYGLLQKVKNPQLNLNEIPQILRKSNSLEFVEYAKKLKELFKEAYLVANEELYFSHA